MNEPSLPHLFIKSGKKQQRTNYAVPHLYFSNLPAHLAHAASSRPTSLLGSGVHITRSDRLQGLYVIGVQGTGKSTLLENLIIQDIEQGLGICLVEPHGDITQHVLARIPQKREKDIVYLDLMQTAFPFGLNLFDCADPTNAIAVECTKSFVVHVFEKVLGTGIVTQQLNQILRNVAYTLIANPSTTFLEIPMLLHDQTVRTKLVANVTNRHVQRFWKYYEKLPERTRTDIVQSMINRVDAFAASPILQTIIGQSTTSIDFASIMNTGKILLIQLPPRTEDITNLIGSVIIGKLLDAAYARRDIPEDERRQFHLYADEFQRFAVEDFATFFTEARKFKVGLTVAHQFRRQLDEKNRGATLTVANVVTFRVTPEDAAELAARFDITPEKTWEEELEEEWVEELKEEWTEKVEDEVIDGTEPIKAISQSPVDFILSATHMNERVRLVRGTLLAPIKQAIETVDKDGFWFLDKRKYEDCMGATRSKLRQGFALINELLVDMMERRVAFGSDDMLEKIIDILLSLRGFLGIESDVVYYSEKNFSGYYEQSWSLAETRSSLFAFVRPYYIALTAYEYVGNLELDDQRVPAVIGSIGLETRQQEQKDDFIQHLVKQSKGRDTRLAETVAVHHSEALTHLDFTVYQLLFLCLALRNDPILVTTGQEQPRKRTQIHYIPHARQTITHPRVAITHPQRSYQDVLNEAASAFARLPNFRAKVTMGANEYTIVTDPPQKGLRESALQERKVRIRESNLRKKYIRSKDEVEREIEQRQKKLENREQPKGQTTSDEDE